MTSVKLGCEGIAVFEILRLSIKSLIKSALRVSLPISYSRSISAVITEGPTPYIPYLYFPIPSIIVDSPYVVVEPPTPISY